MTTAKKKTKRGSYVRTPEWREACRQRALAQRARSVTTQAQRDAPRANMAMLAWMAPLYRPEYCEQMRAYFDVEPTVTHMQRVVTKKGDEIQVERTMGVNFPTFQGFAQKIGVSARTMLGWRNDYPEFMEACAFAKACQEHIALVNGMHGYYQQPMVCLFAKSVMGYADRLPADGGDDQTIPQQDQMVQELEVRREAARARMKAILERKKAA